MSEKATLTPGAIDLLVGTGDIASDADAQAAPAGSVFIKRDGPAGPELHQKHFAGPAWRKSGTNFARNVRHFGAAGDGTTDDRGAVAAALADTQVGAEPRLYFPPGTYRIASDLEFPVTHSVEFARNATLRIDSGVVVTMRSALVDTGVQLFDVQGTGKLRLGRAEEGLSYVNVRWFGAKGDGESNPAADDIRALELARDAAITAEELDPAFNNRYAKKDIYLPRGVYAISRPWEFRSIRGLNVYGDWGHAFDSVNGAYGTDISIRGGVRAGTLEVGVGSNNAEIVARLIAGGGSPGWATNQWKGYFAILGPSNGSVCRILSNSTDTLTLDTTAGYTWESPLPNAPTAGTELRIAHRAGIDINGVAYSSFKNFSVSGYDTAEVLNGIYYHWRRNDTVSSDPTKGANLSTTFNDFRNVSVGGRVITGLRIGEPGTPFQEDITHYDRVSCRGLAPSSSDARYWNNGIVVGTGVPANNLIHTFHTIDSNGWGNGVAVANSSCAIYGGTVQSNTNDFYIQNGLNSYLYVSGIRTEGSRRFIYGYSPYARVFFSGTFEDCEIQANGLQKDPDTGTADVIHWPLAGSIVLKNLRVLNQPMDTGFKVSSVSGSTLTVTSGSGANPNWSVNRYAAGRVRVTSGGAAGQERNVVASGANTLEVESAFSPAPVGADTFDVWLVPVIRCDDTKVGVIDVKGVAMMGAKVTDAFRGMGGFTGSLDYTELDLGANIVARTSEMKLTTQHGSGVFLGWETDPTETKIVRAAPFELRAGEIFKAETLGVTQGGKLAYFGGVGSTRKSVAGSDGGNVALRSLIKALAAYGVIDNQTSEATDVDRLVSKVGGDSTVAFIYDTRFGITTSAGKVISWADARGGFGETLLAGSGGPGWDGATQEIVGNGTGYLYCADSLVNDHSRGFTLVVIAAATASSPSTFYAIASTWRWQPTYSGHILRAGDTGIGWTYYPGGVAGSFGVSPSSSRRLLYVRHAPSLVRTALVSHRIANLVESGEAISLLDEAPYALPVQVLANSHGEIAPGGANAPRVRAVIGLRRAITEIDWTEIKAWAQTNHPYVDA
jgi:hypothetical protein